MLCLNSFLFAYLCVYFFIIQGGYLSFMPDSSNSKGTLVSPLLRGKDWRCMRFWYRIDEGHQAEIKVSVQSLNKTKQLWMSAHKSTRWSFVQLSVNISGTGKVTY